MNEARLLGRWEAWTDWLLHQVRSPRPLTEFSLPSFTGFSYWYQVRLLDRYVQAGQVLARRLDPALVASLASSTSSSETGVGRRRRRDVQALVMKTRKGDDDEDVDPYAVSGSSYGSSYGYGKGALDGVWQRLEQIYWVFTGFFVGFRKLRQRRRRRLR